MVNHTKINMVVPQTYGYHKFPNNYNNFRTWWLGLENV